MISLERFAELCGPYWAEMKRREARLEAQHEERLAMTLRVLARRFGPLDATSEARVRAAGLEELEAIVIVR